MVSRTLEWCHVRYPATFLHLVERVVLLEWLAGLGCQPVDCLQRGMYKPTLHVGSQKVRFADVANQMDTD